MSATFPAHAGITRAESAIWSEIDGEAVILEIESGAMIHLNRLGSRIWLMLDDSPDVEALCTELQQRYDVAADTCRADVVAFVEAMRERGLLRLTQKGSPGAAPPPSGT